MRLIGAIALIASGCTSGGGGFTFSDAGRIDAATDAGFAQEQVVVDREPPVVTVHFPPTVTATEAEGVTVRGVAQDATGIAKVTVNGADASSTDGFGSWSAWVSLQPGANEIVIVAEDVLGNAADPSATLSVRREIIWKDPRGVAFDGDAGRLIAVDHGRGTLFDLSLVDASWTAWAIPSGAEDVVLDAENQRVFVTDVVDGLLSSVLSLDLTTGTRKIVSGVASAGPLLSKPSGIALDAANDQLFVADSGRQEVLAIAIGSGMRTVVSGEGNGIGTAFEEPSGIAYDASSDRLLVIDAAIGGVFEVDPDSGNRLMLSGGTTGSGPPLVSPRSVVFDSAENRVLVGDSGLGAVVAVDLTNGARAIVADGETGSGPALSDPVAIAHDAKTGIVVVSEATRGAVLALNAAAGDRLPLAGGLTGSGPTLVDASGVGDDGVGSAVVVVDQQLEAVIAIDRGTGDRVIAADSATGSGGAILARDDVASDGPRSRALLLDRSVITQVDLGTGDRSPFTTQAPGLGVDLRQPQSVALDGSGERLLLVDAEKAALIAVALADGTRSVLSDATTGEGPAFDTPTDLALDGAAGRVLVIDRGLAALIAVNLSTGARTVISGAGEGSGTALIGPVGLAIDTANGVAFTLDAFAEAFGPTLIEIKLGDGTRRTVTSRTIGTGPILSAPAALAWDGARVLVADSRSVLAVNPNSHGRTTVSSPSVGIGPNLGEDPRGLVVDTGRGRALVLDENGTLVGVALSGGNREILSTAAMGSGPELQQASGLALDAAELRAFATDQGARTVVGIALQTGDRTGLPPDATPPLIGPRALSVEGSLGAAFITDAAQHAVLVVELASGNRGLVSGVGRGSGPALDDPGAIATGASAQVMLVFEKGSDELLRIDVATGDRTVVSGADNSGPALAGTTALALDQLGGRAVLLQPTGLLTVDLATGDRQILKPLGLPTGAVSDLSGAGARQVVNLLQRNALYLMDLQTNEVCVLSR